MAKVNPVSITSAQVLSQIDRLPYSELKQLALQIARRNVRYTSCFVGEAGIDDVRLRSFSNRDALHVLIGKYAESHDGTGANAMLDYVRQQGFEHSKLMGEFIEYKESRNAAPREMIRDAKIWYLHTVQKQSFASIARREDMKPKSSVKQPTPGSLEGAYNRLVKRLKTSTSRREEVLLIYYVKANGIDNIQDFLQEYFGSESTTE